MDAELDECPGAGLCHGCLKWCSNCGDVSHVCDARLDGQRCDCHPVPPEWSELRRQRGAAEKQIADGRRMAREGGEALLLVVDGEIARRAFDRQRAEEERAWLKGLSAANALPEARS